MRPGISNQTILATRQELFFIKVAAAQSIIEVALLGFWLMLLSWMSISCFMLH